MTKWIPRKYVLMLIDALIVAVGYLSAFLLTVPRYLWEGMIPTVKYSIFMVMVVYLAVYAFGGIYTLMWRYADAREYRLCSMYSLLAGGIVIVIAGIIKEHIPLRVQLSSPFTITFLLISSRIIYKLFVEKEKEAEAEKIRKNEGAGTKKRLAIVGAGEAGTLLYRELKSNAQMKYDVELFVDDNPNKIGRRLFGLPIVGGIDTINDIVNNNQIDEIIIAVPTASGEQRKRIVEHCTATDASVKILPSLSEAFLDNAYSAMETGKDILMGKLRNIDVEDLLGRDPIQVKDADVRSYIAGKNVLVTGGGGSIGSELCRQVVSFGAKKLIILDNYENGAYDIEQELIREHQFTPQVEIISVQNEQRLDQLFADEAKAQTPIQVVFHAAAHKHVPLMEHNPERAIRNNILGTYHVATLCDKHQVERMILISTDKAVNPTNVMGATKRACELVVQSMSKMSKRTIYAAVRFGNVLGSNGSVIPLFKKQIEKGGPLTVTHPDIIRYFMTIPEAVSLVLNAGGLAKGGEIFVLDMGEPVRIVDLAKNLIKLSGLEPGKDIDIVFTGLRPGEKLFEELLMAEEGLSTTNSEKIFVGKMTDLDSEAFIAEIVQWKEFISYCPIEYKKWIKKVIPTYREG